MRATKAGSVRLIRLIRVDTGFVSNKYWGGSEAGRGGCDFLSQIPSGCKHGRRTTTTRKRASFVLDVLIVRRAGDGACLVLVRRLAVAREIQAICFI